MSQTDVLPEVDEALSDFDDHAHYVRIKNLVKGGPQIALCGKKYFPTIVGAAVLDLPVCSKCAELMEMLKDLPPLGL